MTPTLPDFLEMESLGFVRIKGHRVGLNHVIRAYREGYSPEMLWEQFPTVSLANIHKTIAFYLENREWVEQYIAEHDAEMDRLQRENPPSLKAEELRRKIEIRRRQELKQQVKAM